MGRQVAQPARPQYFDDRLAYWAESIPEAEALTYLDRTWTWGQWNDRVRRLAGALRDLGIRRGDVVSFLDKNHPACVDLTIAAASLGAANAIINFRLAGDEVDYAVNDSGAKVLIVGTELMPLVEKIRDRLTTVERVIEVTPRGGPGDEYESVLADATAAARDPDVEPSDVCLIMYSSGTTGRPKGAALTQANMIAHMINAHGGWCLDDGDKYMVSMPLFHVGGSSWLQFAVYDGTPIVMTRDADIESVSEAIRQGANRTFLVPAVLAQVLQAGGDAVKLFGRLKTYCYGAAPMPLPLLRAALDECPDTGFVHVYGLTEMCGVITNLLPDAHRDAEHPERLLSAGQSIQEAEVRVVDPRTLKERPVGEAGELWFRTPQLMKGYHNKPEATAEVITADGWRTGDMGRVDEDGFVFVEDRLKDMIISGGENIYSVEVERVLAEHPAVADVAVIGIPDDRWGESVRAVVVLRTGVQASEQDLIIWSRVRLAAYKCPRTVDFIHALPRNPTGKILKRDLRKPFWDRRERAI